VNGNLVDLHAGIRRIQELVDLTIEGVGPATKAEGLPAHTIAGASVPEGRDAVGEIA
jgi:hypothetical protein